MIMMKKGTVTLKLLIRFYISLYTTACIINCLAVRCDQYHFGWHWCILIQNHFGHATDHTRERCAPFLKKNRHSLSRFMKQIINVLLFILLSSNISYSQNDTIRAYHKGEDYRPQLKVKYPGYAIEHEISGVVEYKFHINMNGCLDSLLIINSPHEVLSREVKRVILSLKCDWTPPNSWIFDQFIFNFQ